MQLNGNQERAQSPKQVSKESRRGLRTVWANREHRTALGRPGGASLSFIGLPGPSWSLLWALLLFLFAISPLASAQPAASPASASTSSGTAPRPILPAFGGLSDGGPVLTPFIDRLAFNARADFLILADTPERHQSFVIPYGFSFAALQLVEGGIFTHYVFWKEGERSFSYHAPLSINLKVRLWRWFAKDPNQHFTVVAAYQHEVRTGPFDGPNQLGLHTNLAAVRVAANWPLWLFDIGTSVGALYDDQGRFAVGELGARVGMRLDFIRLEDTRASIEGIVRGLPTYVKANAALPGALDPQNPLGLSGALFFGVNTRMTKTADFGIWAQKGFGDVAALSFGVRILGIFIGDGYMRPQPLWAEILKETVAWIKAQVEAIDPIFREDCIAYDKDEKGADGPPMGHFGRLSDDGKWCVGADGFRAPVNVDLFRNPKKDLLCWDGDYKDCLLHKVNGQWVPIHRPRLNSDCILVDSDGSWLAKIGEPSSDRKSCHWSTVDQHGRRKTLDLEVGRLYHADSRTRHVCYNEDLSGCFVDRGDHPKRWDGQQQAGESLRQGVDELGGKLRRAGSAAADVASGRVNLKTVAQEAAKEAEHAAEHCGKDPLECAKRAWYGAVDAGKEAVKDGKNWWDEPTQDKVNDALRKLPEAEAGMVAGGVVRAAEGVVEHAVEKAVAKAATKRVEKALVNKAEHTIRRAEARTVEHEVKALPPRPEPKGLLSGPPEPIRPPEAGRFIVDPKGNVLIEPKGGSTRGNSRGTFVETRYPNNSPAYQLHEGHENTLATEPHGHRKTIGVGPKKGQEGQSLDPSGRLVPRDSTEAHWEIKR